MKIFCTASSDAYITDKIIQKKFRADDANVGLAGTLDLFKLYDENKLNGTGSRNEISRILVKFDIAKVKSLIGSKINVNSPKFSAKLKLFDVRSGHATPSNFKVIVHPLSKSFDEGFGRDLSAFNDVGAVNFLTASIVNGSPSVWFVSGANKEGLLDSEDIDIIGSGSLSTGDNNEIVLLHGTQHFITGDEDLSVDVTAAISGTLDNKIPDLGFRISFSGSDDSDTKTRFVKRFASRHSSNPHLRPRLEISFPDHVQDHRGNFYFDNKSTVFLRNSRKSSLANLIHAGNPVSGDDSLRLKIVKGSFSKTVNASSHKEGSSQTPQEGVYSASFSVDSEDSTEHKRGESLAQLISREKEVTFEEYWFSSDGTKGFHTGSLTVKLDDTDTFFASDDIEVFSTNCLLSYSSKDEERIRLFGINHTKQDEKVRKTSIKKKSAIFENVYYRVLDANTFDVALDFGEDDESTRVSTDGNGMYFDFHFDILPKGRSYLFEYLISHNRIKKVVRDKRTRFTVI